jgi:PAS domain S-box-containing protein
VTGKHQYLKLTANRPGRSSHHPVLRYGLALLMFIIGLSVVLSIQTATALADSGNSANLDSDPLVFLGNHRLPPMNYLENDQAKGLTVEIAEAMAERMERPVIIELMDWSEAQQLVLDGKADALIQINYTEEREPLYDFSDPLLETEFAIFIPADKPGMTNILDLRGLTVATEAKGFSILVLERDPLINISPVPDLLSGFNLLNEGSVDAVVGDRWVGTYILAENDVKGVAIANHPIDINYSSIAVKKGNTALLAEINKALGEIKQDGTYQRIIDRWQAQEVVYQTVEQERQQRLIIAGSLAALLITLAFVLILLYMVKRSRQAEEALRESEERLDLAMAVKNEGIWDVNLNTNETHYDDRYYTMAGYQPGDFPQDSAAWEERVHEEDLPLAQKAIENHLNGKSANIDVEYRFKKKDGQWMWLSEKGKVYERDESGKPVRIVGTHTDITDRKLAEEALRERLKELECLQALSKLIEKENSLERIFQKWVDIMPVGWRYPEIACARILFEGQQYQSENFRETDWRQAVDLKVMDRAVGIVELCYLEERPLSTEGPFLKEERNLINLISERLGRVIERKRAEEEIRTLNKELEQRVKERTINLEALNKELASFAYSISHDFRAPLRALDAFSANLNDKYGDQLDEQGRHYLSRIRNAALYMSDLIDDLLKLSRITRAEVNPQEVDISRLAEERIQLLQEIEPERRVEVKIAAELSARGDRALLQAALQNLLENAWKFSSQEAQAEIEVGRTTIDGEAVFFVRDNGVGFDMAYADKLFGTFQRLHGADEFPGTGVGLATVQRIISRHGGKIWAESEVGKGATFYFTLPV